MNECESSTLDFKKAQYPFEKSSDEEKSELLKDILSFANAWKRTDAYILIGVEEVKGGQSIVKGIDVHIEEASLQQFVNTKTNKPVLFSYLPVEFDGKRFAIIKIPIQERPIYIIKDFGKLKKEAVYIRRGTSTDIASPDEIYKMGLDSSELQVNATADLEFSDTVDRKGIGTSIDIKCFYNEVEPEPPPGPGVMNGPLLSIKLPWYQEPKYEDYAEKTTGSNLKIPS